ncbi:ABC transporter substrate-binding protein [Alkalicoccus halolimnae]|uniref:ABC transporter substrate-binding protein n=1 Tax=Alkalicoccus halolimnae TaxID=1667239 RepID=A0A5C7F0L5_9BACI|nr:ABC transporter substrate-binding protein [Alkalicoccus halolimnae]TXF82778.1 ABC transporter substrate-binding protein [Alkalicoccus halolimnae]
MKKYQGLIVLSTAVMLTACGSGENEAGNNNANEEAAENAGAEKTNENEEAAAEENNEENAGSTDSDDNSGENAEASGEFPVTITDHAGEEVTIEEEPESIITLQPSDTETLFELGAGDRLVGVSEYCNYPEEALEIENVGAQDMDAERILSLNPDLIFVSGYHHSSHADILDQYREAGINVVVVEGPESFEATYETIEMLGEATGTTEEAEATVTEMKEGMTALAEQSESIEEEDRKKVWVEVAPSPDIFTTGQGTFMNEMLETINAENAAADFEGWASVTEEEIVTLEPDTIVTTYGYYVDDPTAEITERDGWDSVPAVENEDIYNVDSDTVTRSGPRLVEGAEELAEAVYPDVFE